MRTADRELFDDLLEDHLAELPEHLHRLLEEVPLIVEDEPSDLLLEELGIDRRKGDLCGLHWGIALTQRSVEHSGRLPDRIMLFRGPIIRLALSSNPRNDDEALDLLSEQIRITLLHEIGHHFGLDEDDLTELGYG